MSRELLGLKPGATKDESAADTRSVKSKECDLAVGGPLDAQIIVPLVYNPSSLKFEWMQRPSIDIGDLTVSMGDVEKLLSDSYWNLQKFDYASGDLDYAGRNTDLSAADGDTDWYIWKYTWVGGNCTVIQGPRVTSWTNRAAGW